MRTSENINDLCAALAKAQGIMAAAKFDAVNPFFSTKDRQAKYATLAQVWEVCRKPLTDNGLSVIQPVEEHEQGIMVTTRLMHVSGQWIESAITMPLDKRTSQAVGSAISYGRRYSLAAMVGVVADDDDDGQEATAQAPKTEAKPAKAKKEPDLELTEADKLTVAEIRDLLKPLKSIEEYDELILSVKKKSAAVQLAVSPDCLKRKGELLAQGTSA